MSGRIRVKQQQLEDACNVDFVILANGIRKLNLVSVVVPGIWSRDFQFSSGSPNKMH